MKRSNREKLEGTVEVDETYIGGSKSGTRGRISEVKALVCIALEKKDGDPRPGRVRMEVIPNAKGESILSFVERNVKTGSTIGTLQGRISEKYLPAYLDEFLFRFNRRISKNRGKVFYRLLDQYISSSALPCWKLIGRPSPNSHIAASA